MRRQEEKKKPRRMELNASTHSKPNRGQTPTTAVLGTCASPSAFLRTCDEREVLSSNIKNKNTHLDPHISPRCMGIQTRGRRRRDEKTMARHIWFALFRASRLSSCAVCPLPFLLGDRRWVKRRCFRRRKKKEERELHARSKLMALASACRER